ncbi:WXG100 family type VII secretion target [Microbacterium sp. NPDC089698]|jgi:WXG100 family type VII secretion target|uniref:WXG100 family type VII secretion target n=1 Tax=unclassified Microbacterium TaxID=2609290 RepID=UPI00282C9C4C|nr:WXG100 family type VII secretion target [Microbacterium sp.]MDR2322306.1 WXG100 family type VII secretion target [Microbacterium sp.]
MQIRVRHNDIAGLVADMVIARRNIASVLEDLDRRSQQLQSDWSGEARDAYRVAQTQWLSALEAMNDLLRELARRLANTNQHSIDASRSAVSVWQ